MAKANQPKSIRSTPSETVDLYRRLFLLDYQCHQATGLLASLGQSSVIAKMESAYYRLLLEETRAAVSQIIAEYLAGDERIVQHSAEPVSDALTVVGANTTPRAQLPPAAMVELLPHVVPAPP